ncbi:MAG TPA: FAD-dependent oxidoreductase [Candidatus Baltobacteraceae bacterium]|nr:FAD-dependent oxidoreductase [Candidatus Baltobacteraceae bacterium]
MVGGGPAGMMLGYLLARSGVDVTVLEKHGDFLRDFRGDTVHPSTMQVLHELGILDQFLALPHSEIRTIGGQVGADYITVGNFEHVPGPAKFLAITPQWNFLNFIAEAGRAFSGFHLRMNTEATGIIEEHGRVTGVQARSPEGPLEIRADLVVATDGRHSTIRSAIGAQPLDLGAPMDVLWLRLPRLPSDKTAALGYAGAGAIFVMIDRGDYWQCGYVIAKGSVETLRARGIEALRQEIAALVPFMASRLSAIADWDDVKLLEVKVDRLQCWHRPGLLLIGDAAHAMSPVGGVGINLAVQDAVAAANILAAPLAAPGAIPEMVLAEVQKRREWPTIMTQRLQVLIQNRIIASVLRAKAAPVRAPLLMRFLNASPLLQRIPARLVGIGFRPEHIRPARRVP